MTLLNFERARDSIKYPALSIQYYFPRFKNKLISWVQNQFITRRMASFVLASVMLPIAVSPIAVPKVIMEDSYKSHIAINTSSATLLASTVKTKQIVPGESQVQKIAREQAEAEVKALAEAQIAAEKAKLASASRNTVTRERRVYNDPSDFASIYARAEAVYGVDARILRAIHQAETGGSGSTGLTNRSGSGATGPMQFLPSTWRRHGVDGNGDGVSDINNVEDAIYSAAAYLKACGYPNVKKALWGYNPSTSYYNKVMRIAGM